MKQGRPTECTPETIYLITEGIKLGLSYASAAKAAGISYYSLRKWVQRGELEKERLQSNPRAQLRKEEKPYVEFLEALSEAQGKGEMVLAATIKKAAAKDWRAAAWILERRFPKNWSRDGEILDRIEALEATLGAKLIVDNEG